MQHHIHLRVHSSSEQHDPHAGSSRGGLALQGTHHDIACVPNHRGARHERDVPIRDDLNPVDISRCQVMMMRRAVMREEQRCYLGILEVVDEVIQSTTQYDSDIRCTNRVAHVLGCDSHLIVVLRQDN